MCTSVVEIIAVEGAAKNGESWFRPTQAVVTYDHPQHAFLGDAICIDFMREDAGVGTRAAVEITLESAKALHAALARAIEDAEEDEAGRQTPHLKVA